MAHIARDGHTSAEHIINQYEDQHERGSRGFGLISITPDGIKLNRATEPVKAFFDIKANDAPIMVFHHRQPTASDNKISQTHPIVVKHDELKHDYYIIHNGVLRNEDDLFKLHTEELGYVYTTLLKGDDDRGWHSGYHGGVSYQYNAYNSDKFNDSESFAIELARYMEGLTKAVQIEGSAAFIAVRVDKKTGKAKTLMWGRNDGNPVELVERPSGLLIASDITDTDAESLPANKFELLDLEKFFALKKEPKSIFDLIEQHACEFKELPKVESSTPPTNSSGSTSTSVTKTKESEKEEDEYADYPPRYRAFARLAEDITDEIGEEIMDFCQQMSDNEMTVDDASSVGSKLIAILLDKEEISKRKIRPNFDKLEEAEMARINDETMYGVSEKDQAKIDKADAELDKLMQDAMDRD